MRLSVDSLQRVVNRDLVIEFVPDQLTSHDGLGLLRRYVRRLDVAVPAAPAVCGVRGWGGPPARRAFVMTTFPKGK